MSELLARLRALYSNLSARERVLVLAVLALTGVAVLTSVMLSVQRAGDDLEARVEAAEVELTAMLRLRREFDDVNQRLALVEDRIQNGPRGNLRTTLEGLAQQAQVTVESMEPQASPASDRYRETKVEVGLRGVTLPQTVKYLHQIEETAQLLSIKALRIRTRPDKPDLLDVTFTVSSFEPL